MNSRIPRIVFRVQGRARSPSQLGAASPSDVVNLIRSNRLIPDDGREHMGVLLLDADAMVLGYNEVGVGSPFLVSASPRNIFGAALAVPGTAGIVLVHNHQSNDASPSKQDRTVTRHIAAIGDALEIVLVDHLIMSMTSPAFYSFAAQEERLARSKRARSNHEFDRAVAAGRRRKK